MAAALALVMASAGCLTGAQELQPTAFAEPSAAGAASHRLGMRGCEDHVGLVFLPIAADPVPMPEGFRQQPVDPAGLVGVHAALGYACEASEGAADVAGPAGLFAMVLVDPPDDYEAEGIGFYALPIVASWVNDGALEGVFQAWNLFVLGPAGFEPRPTVAGTIALEVLQEGPGLRAGHVVGRGDGKAVHLYTLAEGQPFRDEPGKGRVFSFQDGRVVGFVDLAWTEADFLGNGQAVIQFEGFEAPPPPAILGASVLQSWGETYAYEWTYTEVAEPARDNLRGPGLPRLHGDLAALAGSALRSAPSEGAWILPS